MKKRRIRKVELAVLAFLLAMTGLIASLMCMHIWHKDEHVPYIEVAELTEQEAAVAQLLGMQKHRIFDYALDDDARSVQVNAYELENGQWQMTSGGGGYALDDTSGRIALGFDRLCEGLRVAIQTSDGEQTSASAMTRPAGEGREGMSVATSSMSGRVCVDYEREIPLAVQIETAKRQLRTMGVEAYDDPAQLAGYEHAYAVTVRFSRKTVAELDAERTR